MRLCGSVRDVIRQRSVSAKIAAADWQHNPWRRCHERAGASAALFKPGHFDLCPLWPLQPTKPIALELCFRHLKGRSVSIGVNVGRSRQRNAVQRPEKPDRIREAVALVDAADQPLAAEDVVIDVVLVDAVAKAGWAELEGLKSVVATPVLA
jgi:hypothetical protein